MQKSREGYGKNWTHFVYKLDNLFRSIRVRMKTHLLQRPALHFFLIYYNSRLFCVQYVPFKATSSTFNPFWHHLLFFMHLLICFELNDPEIEKHYKWSLKRLKLVMVSLFHPHSMCKKVERFTAKTGCTSCTNWTISFEVSGFRMKTHLLQRRHFIFLTYYRSRLFCVPYAPLKAMSSTFNPLWHHFLFFMHLLICFELNDPEIEKH